MSGNLVPNPLQIQNIEISHDSNGVVLVVKKPDGSELETVRVAYAGGVNVGSPNL